MLARHPSDFDTRSLALRCANIDKHAIEEVEVMDVCERFRCIFMCKMRLGVRSCYDGEITAQGSFDFLVEMVALRQGTVSRVGTGVWVEEQVGL